MVTHWAMCQSKRLSSSYPIKLQLTYIFFFFPVWSELFYECWNSSAWWVNSRKSPAYVQLKCLYLQLKAVKSSWSCSHVADESRHTDGKYVMPERLNCWLASQRWFLVGMSICMRLLWCLSAGCYGHRIL